jgi:TRAP-type C4-dicarboxylate transport system permease small subunit
VSQMVSPNWHVSWFRARMQELTRGLAVVSALLVMVLVLAITIDSLMRNTGRGALAGVVEYSEIILASLVFLAMPIGQQMGSHISFELVTHRAGVRAGRIMRTVGLGVTVLLIATMAVLAWRELGESIANGEFRYGLLRVPIWPARLAIAIGFTMLALETMFSMADCIRGRPDRQSSLEVVQGAE